jgi:hypothetical protein
LNISPRMNATIKIIGKIANNCIKRSQPIELFRY